MADLDATSTGWDEWCRRRRRQAVGPLIWMTVMMFMVGFPVVYALISTSATNRAARIEAGAPIGTLLDGFVQSTRYTFGGMFLIAAIAVVLSLRSALRDRSVTRIVVETDGCVCPKCMVAMTGATDAPAEHVDDRNLSCERCGLKLDSASARRYWEQTVYSSIWAAQWKSNLSTGTSDQGVSARLTSLSKRHPKLANAISMLLVAFVIVGLAALFGGGPAVIALRSTTVILLLGVWFLLVGLVRPIFKTAETARCAKCGYERPTEATSIAICPECGSNWNRVGGTVLGQSSSPRQMALIVAMVFVLGALTITPLFIFNRIAVRVLPAAMLIPMIDGDYLSDARIVAALEASELDDATRRRLAEHLVGLHDRKAFLPDAVEALLERLFLDGELARIELGRRDGDTLADAYMRRLVPAGIEGSGIAQVGEEIRVQLLGEPRIRPFAAIDTKIAWGGWRIDGGETHGRYDALQPAITLWEPALRARGLVPATMTFRAQRSGMLPITGDLWIVVDPAGVPARTVRWSEAGEPIVEDPPPLAMTRVELRYTVPVSAP